MAFLDVACDNEAAREGGEVKEGEHHTHRHMYKFILSKSIVVQCVA